METKTLDDAPLRIGAVSYLNSKPLVEHLPELFPEAIIREDFPSRLADDLAAGKLDVALIPSVEFFRGEDYEIVSDACVAARGPVFSVKLYSRVPWSDIRSLGLDEGSRTSAALAKILLGERFGVEPETIPFRLGDDIEACPADAVLMIGDRAMRPQDEKFHATWDLGEEWFQWTGLPFVFAMWVAKSRESRVKSQEPDFLSPLSPGGRGAGGEGDVVGVPALAGAFPPKGGTPTSGLRPPSPSRGEGSFAGSRLLTLDSRLLTLDSPLSLARDLGVKSIDEIARREASLLNLPFATTIQYLKKNLHFYLGPAERNGLRLFYDLAARRGLVGRARRTKSDALTG